MWRKLPKFSYLPFKKCACGRYAETEWGIGIKLHVTVMLLFVLLHGSLWLSIYKYIKHQKMRKRSPTNVIAAFRKKNATNRKHKDILKSSRVNVNLP